MIDVCVFRPFVSPLNVFAWNVTLISESELTVTFYYTFLYCASVLLDSIRLTCLVGIVITSATTEPSILGSITSFKKVLIGLSSGERTTGSKFVSVLTGKDASPITWDLEISGKITVYF